MSDEYKITYIKKKNKIRKIITYNNIEKRKQHQFIYNKINLIFKPSIYSKGYVLNESIYTNVAAHVYNNYFYKTDISDFFQSINHKKLIDELYNEIKEIASPSDCYKIVNECSFYDKGLPLGFITSPLLANIYLKRFDNEIYSKLKKLKCENIIYTRYADDMIISFKNTQEDLKQITKEINTIVTKCLKKYHLTLNKKKTRFIEFNRTKQVRITGITIVEKKGKRRISVGRNNKRKLFYELINLYKNENKCDENKINKIKGKLSFYLSIEKTGFEDFLSENMKKELNNLGFDSMIELVKNL